MVEKIFFHTKKEILVMITQESGDLQAKIKFRLEILPEEEISNSDRRLAEEIATRIANSNLLNQAQGYKVEVPDTEEEAQGIPHEILIWIATGVGYIGGRFVNALIDKAAEKTAEKVVEKVADLPEKIREILNNERYRKRQASVKVQFLPAIIDDIHEQGHLADVLTKVGKQLTETSPDPKLPKITEDIEITFSIKVSHKNSKWHFWLFL